MSGFAEMIQRVLDMQRNAQENLPITPNNGNPAGANNMPNNKGGINPRIPNQPMPGGDLSWLQPDPSLSILDKILAGGGGSVNPTVVQPPQPHVPTPTQPTLPVMPNRPGLMHNPEQPQLPVGFNPRIPMRPY